MNLNSMQIINTKTRNVITALINIVINAQKHFLDQISIVYVVINVLDGSIKNVLTLTIQNLMPTQTKSGYVIPVSTITVRNVI